jgi:hypothetical protein
MQYFIFTALPIVKGRKQQNKGRNEEKEHTAPGSVDVSLQRTD